AAARAGAGAAQGVGLRRIRHQPRLGADRPPLGGRWPGGVGLRCGHQRALGALVLLLAPPAGHAGERLTVERPAWRRCSPFAQLFLPRYGQLDADAPHNLSTASIVYRRRLGGNPRPRLAADDDAFTMLRALSNLFRLNQ